MGHFHPFSIAMLNYQRAIHWSTISGSWMGKLLRSCCQSEGFSSQIICPSCNGLETGKKPWRARRAPVVLVVSPKDCLFFSATVTVQPVISYQTIAGHMQVNVFFAHIWLFFGANKHVGFIPNHFCVDWHPPPLWSIRFQNWTWELQIGLPSTTIDSYPPFLLAESPLFVDIAAGRYHESDLTLPARVWLGLLQLVL